MTHNPIVKPVDSWWTVLVVDPLCVHLVPWLSGYRSVTPMRITIAALLVGMAAISAFAAGQLALGALLFEVRFVLDCLDGKLARLRGTSSARGAFLDVASDLVTVGGAYLVLSVVVTQDVTGPEAVLLPLGAAVFFIAVWMHTVAAAHRGGRNPRAATASRSGRARRLERYRLKPYPTSVEVETLVLFLAPLAFGADGVRVAMPVAAAFYLVSTADDARRHWQALDRPPQTSGSA